MFVTASTFYCRERNVLDNLRRSKTIRIRTKDAYNISVYQGIVSGSVYSRLATTNLYSAYNKRTVQCIFVNYFCTLCTDYLQLATNRLKDDIENLELDTDLPNYSQYYSYCIVAMDFYRAVCRMRIGAQIRETEGVKIMRNTPLRSARLIAEVGHYSFETGRHR